MKDSIKNHPKVKDLTKQKFGKLTVLKFQAVIKGQAKWLCRCNCGKLTIIRTDGLKGGTSRVVVEKDVVILPPVFYLKA